MCQRVLFTNPCQILSDGQAMQLHLMTQQEWLLNGHSSKMYWELLMEAKFILLLQNTCIRLISIVKGFIRLFCLLPVTNLSFNYVWTGNPGSTHDATVLRSSDMFSNCNEKIPQGYNLMGDSAFPLIRWLVTPFRDHGNLNHQQRLFNKTRSKCH